MKIKKDVKYLNKDFGQYRQNLINFAKNYFPKTYQDFNESSPGMMFIEMAAYVGDVLSYYTDQSYRESLLSSAKESANILALSQLFGYKPRRNAPATCKLDVFQLVPASGSGDAVAPDMDYALTIADNMEVSSEEGQKFHSIEPCDFHQEPEVTVYEINSSGEVARYLFKKQIDVVSGEVKEMQYNFTEPKPYDKIVLPEDNVMEIISIIDSTGNEWKEVDYLAQDTVFQDIANIPFNDPELSEFRSTVPYILKLDKTARRFVTRLRDDGRVEIQFGSGVSSDADEEIIPNPKNVGMGLEYLKRTTTDNIDPSNFLYTSTYGLAPSNTVLTVKYTFGGAVSENVGMNSITDIDSVQYISENGQVDLEDTKNSVAITNSEPALGGRAKEDLESIKQNAMATFAAQSRTITREDYIARVYAMPSRFGSVAKAYIVGDTQIDTSDKDYPRDTISNPYALNLYVLALDELNNFTTCNQAILENLRTYLSQYRMLTDAINIKSAFIVNLSIEFDIIPEPKYNSNECLLRCIDRLKQLFHNDRMQINGSIDKNAIIGELNDVLGIQSVIRFEFFNKIGGPYSNNSYDIEKATKNGILYPSLDPCIFEVRFPNRDIRGRVVKP